MKMNLHCKFRLGCRRALSLYSRPVQYSYSYSPNDGQVPQGMAVHLGGGHMPLAPLHHHLSPQVPGPKSSPFAAPAHPPPPLLLRKRTMNHPAKFPHMKGLLRKHPSPATAPRTPAPRAPPSPAPAAAVPTAPDRPVRTPHRGASGRRRQPDQSPAPRAAPRIAGEGGPAATDCAAAAGLGRVARCRRQP